MLLYRQNSRQLNSNISRNTSLRPSLQASVKGVRPALFTIPFFAGTFGCLEYAKIKKNDFKSSFFLIFGFVQRTVKLLIIKNSNIIK